MPLLLPLLSLLPLSNYVVRLSAQKKKGKVKVKERIKISFNQGAVVVVVDRSKDVRFSFIFVLLFSSVVERNVYAKHRENQ